MIIIIWIIAPRMTGIVVKIVTWLLESRIFGAILLYILKGNNLIHKVCFWFIVSCILFSWNSVFVQKELHLLLIATLFIYLYNLISIFIFKVLSNFLFFQKNLQHVTNADLEEPPLYVPLHHFEGLLFSTSIKIHWKIWWILILF
jgi:hypothetical protein